MCLCLARRWRIQRVYPHEFKHETKFENQGRIPEEQEQSLRGRKIEIESCKNRKAKTIIILASKRNHRRSQCGRPRQVGTAPFPDDSGTQTTELLLEIAGVIVTDNENVQIRPY